MCVRLRWAAVEGAGEARGLDGDSDGGVGRRVRAECREDDGAGDSDDSDTRARVGCGGPGRGLGCRPGRVR